MDIDYCDHLSILHVHILYHVCGRRHQCYSSLTGKDMTGELHNVDKSLQIEISYNKCGIVDLHKFEVLSERGGGGEEYNMLS